MTGVGRLRLPLQIGTGGLEFHVMVYEAEAGQRRWLLKAIWESTSELFSQFAGVSERQLRWRPEENQWCLKEIAAHLRDAEVLCRSQIEAIARSVEPRLPHEAIDVLPSERDYREDDVSSLLREYVEAREETVWLLRMLDDEDWKQAGQHPYRGLVSIYEIVQGIHRHDLEHLYQAQRLRRGVLEQERQRI